MIRRIGLRGKMATGDEARLHRATLADGFYRTADGGCLMVHDERMRAAGSADFRSILFEKSADSVSVQEAQPPFFTDLNLDQIVAAVVVGRGEYNLEPFFHTPLHDPGEVLYRHDVMRDLERADIRAAVKEFAEGMREMRKYLAQADKLHHKYQKQRWFLDAADAYCRIVHSLAGRLDSLDLSSRGLRGFRDYLARYTGSPAFTGLVSATARLYQDLAEIRYSIHIKGNRVRVDRYSEEPDYSIDVTKTFARFRQGAVKDYRCSFPAWPDMNHVEVQIIELVARLYPGPFQEMSDYCTKNARYLDGVISRFDREVQFYLAYLEFAGRLRDTGLQFCYPQVSAHSKEISASDAFDLALAAKLTAEKKDVVRNDCSLTGPERLLVITGPNQGGKTTFSRMFGQLHYLASLGCLVPARQARLFLPDQIFTHYEREEDLGTLHGKLEDELTRIHDILERATGNSIVVMNESFNSTTLEDALFLGAEVMRRLLRLDLVGVYVTFVDELTTLSEATVSMASTIVPGDAAARTYKVIRKPADGLAYAAAIADKYGLSFVRVKERIAP